MQTRLKFPEVTKMGLVHETWTCACAPAELALRQVAELLRQQAAMVSAVSELPPHSCFFQSSAS